MNAADWVIVAVIGISALLSLLRGFTREALSLGAWFVAIAGARILTPSMAALLLDHIDEPEMRELVAFGLVFVALLLTGMVVAHLVGAAVRSSPLSVGDRLLGVAFGVARGVLIVMVAVAFSAPWLAGESWWQESRFVPPLALLEGWTRETAYTVAAWVGA